MTIAKRKEVTKTVIVYICEACQKEYEYLSDAERCERKDIREKCEHKNTNYRTDGDDHSADIVLCCEDCGPFYVLKTWSLTQLHGCDNQDALRLIADVVEQHGTSQDEFNIEGEADES